MKIITILIFTSLTSFLLFQSVLYPVQKDTTITAQEILLSNGSILKGILIRQDSLNEIIKLENGKNINILKSMIVDSSYRYPINTYSKLKTIRPSELVNLKLNDNSRFIGNVISVEDSVLRFLTSTGINMAIPIHLIKSFSISKKEIVEGNFTFADPNQSHLFFAPTAKPINAGQIYFSDYMVFFPTISAGIGNIISIGGGISLVPSSIDQVYYANLKITLLNIALNKYNLYFAAGGMITNILSGFGEAASVLYCMATIGYQNADLNLGFGSGSSNSGSTGNSILIFGGEIRISNSVKLISEDYYSPANNSPLYSLGLRFFSKDIAGDFALATSPDLLSSDTFPFIPWLSFSYNF